MAKEFIAKEENEEIGIPEVAESEDNEKLDLVIANDDFEDISEEDSPNLIKGAAIATIAGAVIGIVTGKIVRAIHERKVNGSDSEFSEVIESSKAKKRAKKKFKQLSKELSGETIEYEMSLLLEQYSKGKIEESD